MKTIHVLLVTLTLCLLSASLTLAKLPPEARQTLYKARLLMDEEKFTEAARMIEQYMETTREAVDAQVYTVLGGALHQAGKMEKALAVFRKGHAAYPNNEFLCLNTGITLYELKHYGEAGKYLEKTHSLQKPAKAELLFQAGSAYYLGEKYRDAARVLNRLLDQEKKPRKEWIRLAIHSLIEAGQLKRAESLLLRYLTMNPDESEYWKLLAKLHLDREEFSKAGAALEICYRLSTPTTQDLERLASLYNYQEAPLMAASTLLRAYGNSPKPEQALKVAALFASAGRTQQAVNYLQRHSGSNSITQEKGKLLYQARRFEEAETIFRQVLKTKSVPEARFFLALCAWERKDWKKAKQELSRIAGLKQYKGRTTGYLAVLDDLEAARKESGE